MLLNQTSHDVSSCDDLLYSPYILPGLYFIIFPFALLLNGVTAWVSLHLESSSTFVVYLKNLVVADLIITLVSPMRVASKLPHVSVAVYAFSCRFFSAISYSALYTCITFLGLIGLDRFCKIVTPHNKLFGQNVPLSKVVSGSVWLILFGTTGLPNIILSNESVANMTDITCMSLKGQAGLDYHEGTVIFMSVFFWVVCVVISVCYICITKKVILSFQNSGSNNTQGQKRIKLRVFLVVVVFFLAFGPYHLVRIKYTFQQVNASDQKGCSYLRDKFAKDITLWLANANICMDPLLYVFLCREFKEKLTSMLTSVCNSLKVAVAGKAEET